MLSAQNSSPGAVNMSHLHNTAVNVVEAICSVVAMPVEVCLRPSFGTRFYPIPVFFFAALLMIGLPTFSAIFDGIVGMIPFSHPSRTIGMFDIGSLAKLFFLALAVHFVRLYRRVLHVSLESHSRYEGNPLPFFALLPGSHSWWRVRTLYEPLFVFLTATILHDLFIFTSGLSTYLRCAALALAVKSCVSFFRSWEAIRDLIDAGNAAPVLSKLVENTATQEELAPMHLASFPREISEDVRAKAAVSIARAYSATN